MKVRRTRIRATVAGLVLAGAIPFGATALAPQEAKALASLPACVAPLTCLEFEDFDVYSLAFLNFVAGAGTPQPGDPFHQDSSPGFLNQNAITIGTGAGAPVNNISPGNDPPTVDDAYGTPNSVPGGSLSVNFEMMSITDPAPDFPAQGDNVEVIGTSHNPNVPDGNVWDSTTADIRNFIGAGNEVVFFFNLNEENKGSNFPVPTCDGVTITTSVNGTPCDIGDSTPQNLVDAQRVNDGQDMLGFLLVTLTNTTTGAQIEFQLSGNVTTGIPGQAWEQLGAGDLDPTDPGDDILPDADDKWAHVHGEICVDTNTNTLIALGPCTDVGSPAGSQTVNQNLGANEAAFALFNQQLSDLILDPLSGFDLLSVDLRMARIDNGFEQLFIIGTPIDPPDVPEPATLSLLGLGLGALGLGALQRYRRRRQRTAA